MAKYKLLLPKMGESVAEATIIRWTKNPGDYIEADETVMEIATDKVDSDVPSAVAGRLLERFYKDNDVVQVGAAIAIIETAEPEEVKEVPSAPVYQAPVAPKPTPPVYQAPLVPTLPPVVETPSAPVYQAPVVQTPPPAPPVVEKPAPVYQAPVIPTPPPAPPVVEKPTEPNPPVFAERNNFAEPVQVPYTEQLEQKPVAKPDDINRNSLRFYSPLVKNIAAQEGITNAELDQIPGTGADDRLTKDDLLNYIQNRYKPAPAPQVAEPVGQDEPKGVIEAPVPQPPVQTPAPVAEAPTPDPIAPPAPVQEHVAVASTVPTPIVEVPKPQPVVEVPKPEPVAEAPKAEPIKPAAESKPAPSVSLSGGDEIIEMDRMRRLIADHMVMSKQVSPHVTSFVEADVTNLVLWREKVKSSFEKREGEKITFTPIFIEAVVRAIKDYPMINVQVNGTQIIKKKDVNISMATALPSGNLIVPVIKKADLLNLVGLTKSVNDLANRARNGKLKPDDTQGGTFTITNVGSFGNVMGTPIINQPQVAILAVGAIRKKPAVIETLQGDMIGIRHMMFLSLSYDHRVVDGALGGSFVKRVADYLENWDTGREI